MCHRLRRETHGSSHKTPPVKEKKEDPQGLLMLLPLVNVDHYYSYAAKSQGC